MPAMLPAISVLVLLGQVMPAPAPIAEAPRGPRAGALAVRGALGYGGLRNSYGDVQGVGRHLAAGAFWSERTVLQLEYFSLGGTARRSPHAVRQSFFGLSLETRASRGFFGGAGFGWSSLSYLWERQLPPGMPSLLESGLSRSHRSAGLSLFAGMEALSFHEGRITFTVQFRALVGSHRGEVHTSLALLAGVGIRSQ